MTYSRIFLSTLLALVLSACSTESQKKMDKIPGEQTDFKSDKGTTFRVKTYRATSSITKEFNAYGIPKKKVFNFQACLQERLGKTALMPDIPFVIEDGRGFSFKASTDSEGCLSWYETFEYNHIQQETYIRLKRTIRPLSIYTGRTLAETAFTPWANSIFATNEVRGTFLDAIDPEPESLSQGKIKFLNQAVSPIEIAVDTLNFEFKGLDYNNYSVDKFLNLTVAHKYTLRLKPSIIRKTIDNIAVPQVLAGGRLKGYLAIFKETSSGTYDDSTLIMAQEFNLEYVKSTGQFMSDITLKFKNIADMSSRTKALLTLVPLDELEGISEMNYEGVLRPAPLVGLSLSAGTVSAKPFLKPAVKSTLTAYDLLKTQFAPLTYNMRPAAAPNQAFQNLVAKAMNGSITKKESQDLQIVLCAKLYSEIDQFAVMMNCTFGAANKVHMAVRYLVEEITSTPKRVGLTTTEELEMKIGFTQSQRNSFSQGWKASLGAAINGSLGVGVDTDVFKFPGLGEGSGTSINPLKGSLGVKVSGGGEYNYVWEGKYGKEDATSITSSSSMKLTSEGNAFEFTAKVRPCFLVKTSDETTAALAAKNIKAPMGFYACSNQLVQQTRQESWFLVGQNVGNISSPGFSDNLSAGEAPLRLMVRGRNSMLIFYNFLKDARVQLQLEKMPLDFNKMTDNELRSTLLLTQEFPGLLPAN